MTLPFWLVPKLYEQNMVAPKMPDCFDERVWMIVDAEPKNVPLREFSPHFFEFGAMLNALIRDEQLGESLDKAFLERYKSLLCQAHSTGGSSSGTCWRRRRRRCSTRDGNPCDDSWSGSTARGRS